MSSDKRKQKSSAGFKIPESIRRTGRAKLGENHWRRVETFVQFCTIVVTGFIANRCPVRATALAYTTLLSLIPLIAVMASISTSVLKSQDGALIDKAIDMVVDSVMPEMNSEEAFYDMAPVANDPQATEEEEEGEDKVINSETKKELTEAFRTLNPDKVSDEIRNALSRVNSGSLGATGMIGLVVIAIMMFSTIEATFNDIWGVTRGRSWASRIVQYWATVTLGPLIPLAVYSLNIFTSVDRLTGFVSGYGILSSLFLEVLMPLGVLALGFAFFYQLMPNTKVRFLAALVGGLVAGALWQLNSKLSVLYVSKAVTYVNIYGSLAIVPLFLVALYFSWLILLFGAQVAYAFQNRVAYLQEREAEKINFLGREFLALRIMTLLGQWFDSKDDQAPGLIDIGARLRISTRLVEDVIDQMIAAGLVVETSGNEPGYTPARPLEKISCNDILMAMRQGTGERVDTADDKGRATVGDKFARILEAERKESDGISLRDMVGELDQWEVGKKRRSET